MAKNNDLVVTAGLNIEASTEQIKTELGDIGKDLSDKKALKITCHIDSASVRSMQTELSKATKNQAKVLTDAMDIKIPRGKTAEVRGEVQKLIDDYKKFAEIGDEISKENTFNALVQYMDQFERETKIVNEELVHMQNIIKSITKVKGQIVDVSSIYPDLEAMYGTKRADESLTKLFGGKNRWTNEFGKGTIGYDQIINEINGILNPKYITEDFGLDGGRFSERAEGVSQLLQRLYEESNQLNEEWEKAYGAEAYADKLETLRTKLNEITGVADADGFVTIFDPDDFEAADNPIKEVTSALEAYGEAEEKAGEQSEYWRKQQELTWQAYEKTVANIEKAKLSIDEVATREEVTSGEIVNYNERFKDIMDEGITNASKLKEARDTLSAIDKEFQILNAQMVSELPHNVLEGLTQRIAKADSAIKVLTVDYQKLDSPPKELMTSFEKLQELAKDFDFNTDLRGETKDSVTEKVQAYTQIRIALNETQSLLKVAQKEEASFNREFEKALKEEEKQVALEQKRVEMARQLREEQQHDYWQGRFEETVKGITAENTELKALKEQLLGYNKAAKETEAQQKKAFQDENRVADLQNRISKLTAEVNRYATANERAVNSNKLMSNGKSFADEWLRITTQMAKGAELSDREVKDLTADMAVFKKEASAAGLAGASAWDKFLNSFKVMSSYLTANMVFNMVKRQLRDMANEVVAVDTAMTELRKVTEATDADLEKFAKSAAATGRELGASISDVINATATFARLGESLPDAEELGRVATLFKNVGDGITEEQAAEDLVSTMKAFNIEANDSISIVDKFNEVGELLLPKRNYIG